MDGTIPAQAARRDAARDPADGGQVRPALPDVFHAGDGNLHPLILFNDNDPEEVRRAEYFGVEILELSWRSRHHHWRARRRRGEDQSDVLAVHRSRAGDVPRGQRAFDPAAILNPAKAIPTLHRCASTAA